MLGIESVMVLLALMFAVGFVCGILFYGIADLQPVFRRPRAKETPKVENTVIDKHYPLIADTMATPGCRCSACEEGRRLRHALSGNVE